MSRLFDRFIRRSPKVSLHRMVTLATLFLVVVTIFIFSGGIYDIMMNPPHILPSPTNPVFWYPGMTDQTFNESAYFMVFLIMGSTGAYLAYTSTRYAYRPREAKMLLLVGIVMMIISTTFSEVFLQWKLS